MIRHTVAYGYKVGDEVIGAAGQLPTTLPVKAGYELLASKHAFLHPVRKPMSACTGFEFADAAPIRCDLDCVENFVASAAKRIASETEPINPVVFDQFTEFIDQWMAKHLKPLTYDVDLSFEHWIENTNYTRRRKDMLRKIYDERHDDPLAYKHTLVKMFGKDETYADWKYMRGILPRSDYFKIHLGPMMKAIENVVYEKKYFIKHIPERLRPDFVMRKIFQPGAKNFVSDHTSFEAAFNTHVMWNVERRLYDYMTRNLPEHSEFMALVDTICGESTVCGKNCKFQTEGRMSGEMCTSLGNGFTNLMVMLFTLHRKGCTSVKGVVEGDDGLFTFFGDAPTTADFAEIGFKLKLEVFDSLSQASFCGMIFDENDKIILTDAIDAVLKMGWSSRQYTMASEKTRHILLRSKAYSYAHMYWNCPIIGAAARAAIRLTADVCDRDLNRFRSKEQISLYEFEERALNESVSLGEIGTPIQTRVLYERLYGVSISDQLRIEEWFDNLSYLHNLRCPFLNPYFTQQSVKFNDIYVVREAHLSGYPPIPDNRHLHEFGHILTNAFLV